MSDPNVHPPTKVLAVIGIVVAFWLLVTLIILAKVGITQGWPAFLILPLFFLSGGADRKRLVDIFVGAAVGLLLAAAIAPVVGFLVKSAGFGLEGAILLVVGLMVFLIVALGGAVPVVFNNFTFVYYTVALIFTKQETIHWLGTLVIGGAFFVGTILLSLHFVLPLVSKGHQAKEEKQA